MTADMKPDLGHLKAEAHPSPCCAHLRYHSSTPLLQTLYSCLSSPQHKIFPSFPAPNALKWASLFSVLPLALRHVAPRGDLVSRYLPPTTPLWSSYFYAISAPVVSCLKKNSDKMLRLQSVKSLRFVSTEGNNLAETQGQPEMEQLPCE